MPTGERGPDRSLVLSRDDGFVTCPVCGGPAVCDDVSESGRFFWTTCLLCGRSYGVESIGRAS